MGKGQNFDHYLTISCLIMSIIVKVTKTKRNNSINMSWLTNKAHGQYLSPQILNEVERLICSIINSFKKLNSLIGSNLRPN